MTAAPARPPSSVRGLVSQLLAGGRSTGLFIFGALFDTYCVVNVPGAAEFGGDRGAGSLGITDGGVVLWLVAVVAWGSVYTRRRRPLVTAIAGAVLAVAGISYALLLVGVYQCLIRWPRRQGWIGGAAGGLVLLYALRESLTDWGAALTRLGSERPADPPGFTGTVAPWIIAALALALVAGLVAYRRTSVDAARSRSVAATEHRRAETLGEQVARQAERERIARDLHDGLGHRLSSAALTLGVLEAQASAGVSPDPAQARIAREQVHAALEDVRGVVGGLRSDTGDAPLTPASIRFVGRLVHDLRAAGHRLDAYVMVEGADRVGAPLDAAAFRILQESLTNAIKHAPGSAISVTFDAAPERGIRIRVTNPLAASGAGVPGSRTGLIGIRERAAAVGGTAWIGPYEGEFIVDVSLPWGDPA
jgi:signal transduction histidine kinase